MNNKKLVVLTGSFNPVTKAHYTIMSDVVERLQAEKGLFVLTNNEYLIKKTIVDEKTRTKFRLSDDVRKDMIDSLYEENPKLFFGGFELGGASPSTERTLRNISKKYNDYEIYFLCGADKLKGISHWTDIEKLLERLYLVCYCRSDINVNSIIENDELLKKYQNHIIVFNTTSDIEDISSTEIRNRYFNNQDYSSLMNKGPYDILKQIDPSSFKELTTKDIIENTIKYGGRFSGNESRKLVYNDNKKLFDDWRFNNNTMFGDRNKFLHNTKVYKEEFKVVSDNNYETITSCVNDDCVNVCEELVNKNYHPAVLNLASNHVPCGGYRDGSGAQEESLCLASTLSQSLFQFHPNPKIKSFIEAGVEHIPNIYPMDINYGGIYTPNVCFFRNNIDNYYTLKAKPFYADIITVASLSNHYNEKYCNDECGYFNETGYLTKEGLVIEKNKIRTILRIALDNKNDALVLGAFGCGVYNLKCDEVSNLFKEILNEKEFKNKFKVIVFAILEGKDTNRHPSGIHGKFKPFYDVFNK